MQLNAEEAQQMRLLMAKAAESNPGKMAGDEGFALVEEEMILPWGAMTNGSKRREESNPGEPEFNRAGKTAPSGYLKSPDVMPPWSMSAEG